MHIDPITSGLLTVTVRDTAGVLVTNATATAKVYGPSGLISGSEVLTNAGGGDYLLAVQPEWSTGTEGQPIQGRFKALVTATVAGSPPVVHTALFHWRTVFRDEDE